MMATLPVRLNFSIIVFIINPDNKKIIRWWLTGYLCIRYVIKIMAL
jgi:hypothetical protein